jgi:hypothetical protein
LATRLPVDSLSPIPDPGGGSVRAAAVLQNCNGYKKIILASNACREYGQRYSITEGCRVGPFFRA